MSFQDVLTPISNAKITKNLPEIKKKCKYVNMLEGIFLV